MRNEVVVFMGGFATGYALAMARYDEMVANALADIRHSPARALVYAAGTTAARAK